MRDRERDEYADKRQLDAWCEWKEICSLVGCSTENQLILGNVALRRFNKWCTDITYSDSYNLSNKYEVGEVSEDSEEEPVVRNVYEAFHRFEIHAVTKKNGELNKSYKDYLFHKALNSSDPVLQAINGILKAMMRDVVKEYLRKERGFRRVLNDEGSERIINNEESMEANEGYYAGTLSDMAAGPEENAELEMMRSLAEQLAEGVLRTLTPEEKLASATEYFGFKESDKRLLEIVGIPLQTFNDCFARKIPRKILVYLRDNVKIPDDVDIAVLIKNLNLSKGKKLPIGRMARNLDFIYLLAFVNQSLKKKAFDAVKNGKDSEKRFADFLIYCEEKRFGSQMSDKENGR